MDSSINKMDKEENEGLIDYELDLTSDKEIRYFYNNKFIKPNDIQINYDNNTEENNKIYKEDIYHFITKLIDFGFFLSGFVIFYAILKIKELYKKKNSDNIEQNYNKKIYKKDKINNEEIKYL